MSSISLGYIFQSIPIRATQCHGSLSRISLGQFMKSCSNYSIPPKLGCTCFHMAKEHKQKHSQSTNESMRHEVIRISKTGKLQSQQCSQSGLLGSFQHNHECKGNITTDLFPQGSPWCCSRHQFCIGEKRTSIPILYRYIVCIHTDKYIYMVISAYI